MWPPAGESSRDGGISRRDRSVTNCPQAVARRGSGADRRELAPVALELLALGVDHVGGGAGDEALVREHPLGPRDLLLEPRPLRLDVAVRPRALGLDHGRENPRLVVAERDELSAPAED